MVDWRELGEVPDSEDDGGIDSQNTEPEALPELPIETTKTNEGNSTTSDIWDIPSSQGAPAPVLPQALKRRSTPESIYALPQSPQAQPAPASSPLSSLLSSPKSSQELPNLDDLVADQSALQALPAEEPYNVNGPSNAPDENSGKLIQIPSSTPDVTDREHAGSSLPRFQASPARTPLQSQILGHDVEYSSARQVAVQYERSLRTRKPEQMRPYFTEQARFNNSWRKHGLRPLRFANAESVPREDQDAGERDFEPPSEDSYPQQPADDSQGLDSGGGMDGVLFGTLSSSPVETSPLNNRAGPSSRTASQGDTDNTSIDGDDLPSLHDLAQKRYSEKAKSTTKRKLPPVKPAIRKRMRMQFGLEENTPSAKEPQRFIKPPDSSDPFAFPDDPDEPGPTAAPAPHRNVQIPPLDTNLVTEQRSPGSGRAGFAIESDPDEGARERSGSPRKDPSAMDSETESSDGSNSEPEAVDQNIRRIRGVLPASWLRLDQQSGRNKIQKKVHGRRSVRSPQKEPRRGVALPRLVERSTAFENIFSDESEDEVARAPPGTDDGLHSQTRLVLEPAPTQHITEISTDEDAGSAMEDNQIDRMVSGRKRQTSLSDTFGRATKRPKTTSAASRTQSLKIPRQPKITSSFGGSSNLASTKRKETTRKQTGKPPNHGSAKTTKKAGRPGRKPAQRSHRPPQLSILDVIEPDAPRFLKIAARAAKASRNQGRACPTRKTIQLANRQDHIDAASVLDEWKKGSIKQRLSVTSSRKAAPPQGRPAPLTERSANGPRPRTTKPQTTDSSVPRGGSRKLTKQISDGGRISYKAQRQAEPTSAFRPAIERNLDAMRTARPAQLELDNADSTTTASFHAGKKLLDRVYRAKRGKSTANGSIRSNTVVESITPSVPAEGLSRRSESRATTDAPRNSEKPRRRKSRKPQHIDVDDPQYSHAHDPLPIAQLPVADSEPATSEVQTAKLQGLGPYGTRYTIHFEVFPLHPDVYFHHSTLLGSGQLAAVLNEDLTPHNRGTRPGTKLFLGEQMMTWGPWNAQVSSEMGVVFDYVADYLEKDSSVDWPNSPTATAAAAHIFSYVKSSMSFPSEGDTNVFVSRILELVQSFNSRIASSLRNGSLDQVLDHTFRVFDRLLLVTFLSMKLAHSDPTMLGEHMQFESLLKSVAITLTRALTRTGLLYLKHVCRDLVNIRLREKGLREDAPAMHSWVLLFRVLESARIPRASFWDVVQTVVTPADLGSSVKSQDLEQAWDSIFTLLPLTEFDDNGIIIPGWRHRALTDGWPMAQKLLKRVFELYQTNPRQSPSFNNYCRALVGRCHYLVQQWGWRRCSSVVGIIFDFFGSQQLGHLRNEEAYGSPQFLEELSRSPSLDLQADDKCFHIFLKLVALSIRKLREDGLTKDIRNLIARTLPNHTRQHLKEQTIHEHDLAALRNHHDLLCTLFWAAPLELRPNVNLIERLVVPASSHKEACLINLRAWSQLARFVIASGEATTSFAPFSQWRNNFFQQMMHQYDTVASDIEQQFQGLSKDVSQSVSPDMVKAMVSANKAAVMDVIHSCVSSSLDVMRCAGDLEAATFALSTLQLQHIFKHFFSDPPEFDWSILRTCLSTLESFLSRVDEFKEAEESQQSESQILNSAQADDALLVLDHELAGTYFSMARRVLCRCSGADLSTTGVLDKAGCVQQIVVLGARMGMRFIHAGVMNLGTMFRPGKHGLFLDLPHKLGLEQRRYLTLFVATLLKSGFDGFNDDDFTLLELWMLAIVKPRDSLMYENQLAEQLAQRGVDFVPQSMVGLAASPDYGTNRDLFKCAISSMRRSVRDAGPNLRKILMQDHQKTLRLVMDQMKEDLKTVSEIAAQHSTYVYFVRDIVSLIRAHGSDICTVDEYFYQISKEYSPSVQDPQLQVAGMVSYGLRLAEGDSRVAYQLFFFLFNNFKFALISDKLGEEVAMLEKGIRNPSILNFLLGKMLPSIIRALNAEQTASPLLDVYAFALSNFLEDGLAPPELSEDNLGPLRLTLEAIIDGLKQLDQQNAPSGEMLHLARQLVGLLNVFWPSLHVLALSGAFVGEWLEVRSLLADIRAFAVAAVALDLDMTSFVRTELGREPWVTSQLGNSEAKATAQDSHIGSFTENIVSDVRKNWIVTGDRLSIQAPGKIRNTQSTQTNEGIQRPRWGERKDELLADFKERIREWNRWWEKAFGDGSPRHRTYGSVILGF